MPKIRWRAELWHFLLPLAIESRKYQTYLVWEQQSHGRAPLLVHRAT